MHWTRTSHQCESISNTEPLNTAARSPSASEAVPGAPAFPSPVYQYRINYFNSPLEVLSRPELLNLSRLAAAEGLSLATREPLRRRPMPGVQAGYEHLVNVVGGWAAWEAAGLPVE